MTSASVDMFTASSIMVLLLLASIYGVTEVAEIYGGRNPDVLLERSQEVARYILLSPGEPAGWGVKTSITPMRFGLAEEGSERTYCLDIDKVSRLYNRSLYALSYTEIWEALGVDDLSFRIELEPLFNVSLTLSSTEDLGDETLYTFHIHTSMEGLPLEAELRCYLVVRDYLDSKDSSTDESGEAEVSFRLPNDFNGSALLVALARTGTPIHSFGVLHFSHRSQSPSSNGFFVTLSPLNYTLDVEANYLDEVILSTRVLTYYYNFNLTQAEDDKYSIPRLLDPSPMILIVTGLNGTEYFAEWVTYPPVPLEVGADTALECTVSGFSSLTYTVEVAGVLYRLRISLRGPGT